MANGTDSQDRSQNVPGIADLLLAAPEETVRTWVSTVRDVHQVPAPDTENLEELRSWLVNAITTYGPPIRTCQDLEDEAAALQEIARLDAIEKERNRQDSQTGFCKDLPLSDIGNAKRLVKRHGRDLLYCHPWKKWFIWDGTRWAADDTGKIMRLAKDTAMRIGDEAHAAGGSSDLYKWAGTSQSHPRINAMAALTQSEVPVLPADLDADPNLINFPNGTLELDTFTFREHKREDRCTKTMGCEYLPDAICPEWDRHLKTVFAGDDGFVSSFKLMCGYSLITDNPEQILFVLHGSGKNGKSVTVGTLRRIWGDYGWNLSAETLMARRYTDPTAARSDLAALQGVRLATASESDGGTRLSESVVKILTGGDDLLTVRRQYESEFTFKPGAKVWLITNHLPTIRGTDEAIWRRIWLIPFNVTIPEENRDPHMGDRLIKEAPGILNWCLAGLKEYLHAGKLEQPEIVTQATSAYREDQDLLGDFISERCDIGPAYQCTNKELFQAYTQWCAFNGDDALKQKTFGILMGERFTKSKNRTGKVYHGVKIREQSNILQNSQIEPGDGSGPLVTDKGVFLRTPLRDNMKRSYEKSNNSSPSVTEPNLKRLENLISEYDLPPDTDISRHVKFTQTGQYCTCKGCGEPVAWQALDKVRPLPLCDQHYEELKTAQDRKRGPGGT